MLRSRCFKLAVKRSRNDTIKRRTGLFKGKWTKIPAKFDTYKLSDDYIAKPFLGPTGSAFTGAFVGVHCNDMTGMRKPATFEYFKYQENRQEK